MKIRPSLPWLEPGEPFPPPSSAWPANSPAPGLLAAGGALDTQTLCAAYRQGIFPWFSAPQPHLWWTPDPRMVLMTDAFKLHRSLRKVLHRFLNTPGCEIRMDSAFNAVIQACANSPREGQDGTWIVPEMVAAYQQLHCDGIAHSVETWIDGELAGGLYCVNIGRAVFGESMFTRRTDASKLALAALVAFARTHGVQWIDCQQNTRHLASLGAAEIPRQRFQELLIQATPLQAPHWEFKPLYWQQLQSTC
jgi:leucyl/phenylalanyl-tRNA---protein transferase